MESKGLFIRTAFMVIAATLCCGSFAFAQIEIVTDGLVSFWSFDKSTIVGDTVKDLWGSNHGTLVEDPKSVDGKINEALAFDGQASLVEINDSESLDITEAITIEFWFTKTGMSSEAVYPRPVSKGQATVDDGAYGVWVADQPTAIDIGFRAPGLQGGGGQNDFRSAALPDYMDGGWYHVAVTYDGESGRIYFDGEKVLDIATSGEFPQTDDPLHIGDGNNQRHFNGAIDEVRIYNRDLEEDEILQNFNAKSNSLAVDAESRLAGLWGFLKVK